MTRLRASYIYTIDFLRRHDIEYIPATAGPFLFAKLCQTVTANEPMETSEDPSRPSSEDEMLKQLRWKKLALMGGAAYHCIQDGWFRIAFGVTRKTLDEGLRRLEKALKRAQGS